LVQLAANVVADHAKITGAAIAARWRKPNFIVSSPDGNGAARKARDRKAQCTSNIPLS